MKEFNCDSLKNLPVPVDLVKKALDIPQSDSADTAASAAHRYRWWAIAASVILAAALSVTSYSLFRNMKNTAIYMSPAVESTAEPTAAFADDPMLSTAVPDDPIQPTTDVQVAAPLTPADEPTEPEQPVFPKDADTYAQTETAPTTPPIQPTEKPVVVPSEEPTEADPPDPSGDPDPTEGQEPISQQHDNELASVGFMVPISSYTGSEDLYCRLYSSGGRLIGGEDLFDESRRVYFTTGSGYLFLSYPLSGIADPLPPDNYTIVFYDADGNDFYICSAFLSRK